MHIGRRTGRVLTLARGGKSAGNLGNLAGGSMGASFFGGGSEKKSSVNGTGTRSGRRGTESAALLLKLLLSDAVYHLRPILVLVLRLRNRPWAAWSVGVGMDVVSNLMAYAAASGESGSTGRTAPVPLRGQTLSYSKFVSSSV